MGNKGYLPASSPANETLATTSDGPTDRLSSPEVGLATTQHSAAEIEAKYSAERSKRLRPDFDDQFVKLHTSEQFKRFTHDPWLPADGSTSGLSLSKDKIYKFKFVIQGAGYGGLLYAARLVEAGFNPKDMVGFS